ncbi:hypothetical protein ACSFC1_03385 [Pseudothermotoga sp. U03pept]
MKQWLGAAKNVKEIRNVPYPFLMVYGMRFRIILSTKTLMFVK